jgi:TonB family protein
MNFVLPDGFTSRYCMHLADELSSEIGNQQKSVRMIDRALLQTVLERERISSQLQNEEPVARWLGKKLNATTVLVGSTKRDERGSLQLSTQLLSVTDGKHSGLTANVSFLANEETADLKPTDGLPALPPITATSDGEKIYKANRGNGMSPPSCFYVPSPSYTDEARKAKFSGTILVEGIINADGTLEPVRVVRGAPFGLNGAAFSSMTTWKCRAATYGGKPVPTLVSFEVNFHIY